MTTVAASEASPAPVNRIMIVISLMLGTVMTALDTTIANVALPHMAGSVSASGDQIAWVLTSYMIATAIITPLSGWLTNRFGRKQVLMVAATGFVIASALCGASTSLSEIVAFRVLQGMFAAPLMPVAQALLLDLYSVAERGPIMAVWGMGVAVAPITGPVLGGWLTDALNWRWVFYVNLPLGALCLLGMAAFVPESERKPSRFDMKGFAMLSIALAAGQIMLDRGQGQGWFESSEIVIEAVVAAVALWFFVVHSLTTAKSFLPLQIFTDRNFVMACLLTIFFGLAVMSVSGLLPSMMQTLYGFPVLTTGLLTAPRSFGSVLALLIVGRLIGKVDTRILLAVGLCTFAFSFFEMSRFTLDTPAETLLLNGIVQGFAAPFFFLPMTTIGFLTLAPEYRADAAAITALVRYIAGSGGISIMLAMVTNFSVGARDALITPYSPDNPTLSSLPSAFNLADPSGVVMLSHEVDRQAAMLGYTQVFFGMFVIVLAMAPLLFLLKPPNPVMSEPAK